MQTNECSVIKEVPFTVNLTHQDEVEKLNQMGESVAAKEHLHYEGYIVFTDVPYSVEKAKPTLFFN